MKKKLSLFEGIGIELEYMIVNKDSLDVAPICDELLNEVSGEYVSDYDNGSVAWSNELVMHVVEIKTNGPRANLKGLSQDFQKNLNKINISLKNLNCKIMPSSAHPWMNPLKDTKLWSHENNEIYDKYDEIFSCKGHGWSNIQSVHINLPFQGDEEFKKLHSAIRLVLPLLPAIAASSPIFDMKPTGFVDSRLNAYRYNQKRIPSIAGKIIPELIISKEDYKNKILKPIYKDISQFDKEGILQHEWLNSRGAIARFERDAIEIRLLDIQEAPIVDLAIVSLVLATIKGLVYEKFSTLEDQMKININSLVSLLDSTISKGKTSIIEDKDYLACFGLDKNSCTVNELWKYILDSNADKVEEKDLFSPILNNILEQGNLSERILASLDNDYSKKNLKKTYEKLCLCLESGKMFLPKK